MAWVSGCRTTTSVGDAEGVESRGALLPLSFWGSGVDDCLVVGGGVVGQLTALLLAEAGLAVTLIEQAELGRESSWAGGGIVSPLYPWRYTPAVSALAHWSQGCYSEFGIRLSELTGIDPEVYSTGLYWLDLHDQEDALSWAALQQRSLFDVPIDRVYAAVPQLASVYRRALFMPDAANVRNPRLLKALRVALDRCQKVRIWESCRVERVVIEAGRCAGLLTAKGVVRAPHTVLAAGAWSGSLLASLGLSLPVEPVKGQMILYRCAEDFLSAIVLAKGRYAIPRKDGHILVGSTLEHVGFDKVPTEEALASLRGSAEELLPALEGEKVVGHWAGLRPGSPEGIPFIGQASQYPGLWLNCGHYRNGLVLAPASCELLKNLMLGEMPIVDPAPYSLMGRLD